MVETVMIRGTTQLLGVIGDPVKHSFSPAMHNAAIAHLGVDYVYLPLPVPATRLKEALLGFEAVGLRGFNITIPHKQAIIPLLTTVSETAQAIGAVNTVWRTESGWNGTNTDMDGFLAPLRNLEREWQNVHALILGNGGAARAVVAGCAALGCAAVQVVGRNADKLDVFKQSWQTSTINTTIDKRLSVHPWAELSTLIPQANLIVNTTPVGMAPYVDASPLSDEEAIALQPYTIAYDLIYTPSPTVFLQQAAHQGAIAIDGLEMLVQQGAAALSLWLQQPAPVEIMRQALLEHLAQRR